MAGGGLHARTTIQYAMEACRGRFPCISCGFGEARRLADVTLHSGFTWDPAWHLRSTTRLLPVHYARPCEVTWLDIDITRRFVAPVVEEQLGEAAKIIDQNVPALTGIRPQAEQIWSTLQTPFELAPRTWLVLDPINVALSPVTGSGSTVTTVLHLRAQTRVVLGARPVAGTRPLPSLTGAAPGPQPAGMRVPFDLELSYEEASLLATRDYGGKTWPVNGRSLTVESIRLAPGDGGRVRIEASIDYRGGMLRNYRGVVLLEGTPRFDAATSTIIVPDLDYILASQDRGLLSRIVERAVHDSIRDRLRDSARFALGPRIAAIKSKMSAALNRQLAPGVHLRGQATAIEPVSVTPLAHVITVRVVATGTAELDLR